MPEQSLLVVGGGPAGLALLLAAHRHGRFEALLDRGVTVVEQSDSLGDGDLGRYAINSDSTGLTFVECLKGPSDGPIAALRDHPLTREVAAAGDGPVPLVLAARLGRLVGQAMEQVLRAHPRCRVLTGHRALSAHEKDGCWHLRLRTPDGDETVESATHLVTATGAHQPAMRLLDETVGGHPLSRWADRLTQSGDVLTTRGLRAVGARLRSLPRPPRVAVVGGSTSAVSVVHTLLNRLPDVEFGAGGVTLLHRRPLRIFYASAEAARAEGYDEWGPDDVCPLSGRVFRLAGFRLDQRELVMSARGLGNRPPEPRFRLHRLRSDGVDDAAARILDEADIVVAALGYRPLALPLFDRFGAAIALRGAAAPSARLVDRQCRVLGADLSPVPRVFGIGLAAGFVPDGVLGGEPSFSGQANGLWLWQNDVGLLIVDAVLADAPGDDVCPMPGPSRVVTLSRPADTPPMTKAAWPAFRPARAAEPVAAR